MEILKKHLTIIGFLLVSGVLGYGLAYLSDKPELTVVLAPAINYALFAIKKELEGEGVNKMVDEIKNG